ncbi:HAD family hydrolase [Natronolimnohabitans innermongolicus]|uniref:HAD-superfamily hydrolase n=1 Tax=Natronolimnohabitans innermongolicus JCM 12255 TaxID=1227499 RepID=L9WT41_9EURY|nr:HAD family hydrolase [Natronolimnohabitans innermongolicus]ELY52592.1 HAD-superfamily hydrolase [Natronolimnohabitans innermongolicus JCM 12255]
MSIDAALFDLDDTLYPYPPCNRAGKEAAFEAARERGYDLDRDGFESLYQAGRRAVKREVPGTAASHERFLYVKRGLELHAGTAAPGDARAIGEAFWEAYLEAMTCYPAVEETLAGLRERGIDVGIVTNLTTRIQLAKLERLGLAEAIDLLLTSEETGREKPGSVMFTLPLARLDRRASEVVMVGDDVDADIVGANAVGLETVLFDPRGEVEESLEGEREPDHRIDAFAKLSEVIL